jgi:hypothetical protein
MSALAIHYALFTEAVLVALFTEAVLDLNMQDGGASI